MLASLRRTLALALAALAVALPTAAAPASETREATGFTAIALSAPIRVDLVLGEREGVVLEGDPAALARIETSVEKGALRIRFKERTLGWNHKVRARVTARRIEALSIGGSGDIHAPELNGEALTIDVAGSGDVVIGGGKVGGLTVNIAGSGDVRTGKLESQRVKVSIAGSGDVTVWARESLAANVVGSGDVRFYGDPAVKRSVVGSGEVRRLGAAPS